jgi:Ferritin-like
MTRFPILKHRLAMTSRPMTDLREPDIVIGEREQLAYLLTEAAEIEHGLMCCYLYAAYSLKRGEGASVGGNDGDRLSAEEGAAVAR